MSRPALTPRVRDELLKLLLDQVAADRSFVPAGSRNPLACAENLTRTENALLLLTGAVFGDAAEQELGRRIAWEPRAARGESWWLQAAALRADEAAEAERAQRAATRRAAA